MKKKSLEEFKQEIIELGNGEYTFIEEVEPYKNKKSKVLLRHKCNYEWITNRDNFVNRKNRCPLCNGNGNTKWTYKNLQNFINIKYNKRFKIVDERFLNNEKIIENKENIKVYDNSCKHSYKIPRYYFIRNDKIHCPICGLHCKNITTERYKQEIYDQVKNEYTLLEDYQGNTHQPLLIKHNKCNNTYYVSRNNFIISKKRCPFCCKGNTFSYEENEIEKIIKSFSINVKRHVRNIIGNQELDFYIPDKKIAIEFDSLYFHSEKFHKDKNYHLEKTIKCEEKGIRLIHIFGDEWEFKKDIVISKLLHILGCNNNPKVYARKCYIEEISTQDKNQFLEENHIQGKDNSCIKLGLWYPQEDGDRLVSVMTFCKPRKALGQSNTDFDYELSRFASDIEYLVIGGFSKLFSYFKNHYEWSSIITYADRRWSVGNVYETNNFYLDHLSKPNYWYISNNNSHKREYRYKYRKQKLKDLFPSLYSEEKTESQIMLEANYTKIWDCGNMVYVFKNHKINEKIMN